MHVQQHTQTAQKIVRKINRFDCLFTSNKDSHEKNIYIGEPTMGLVKC